MPLPRLTPLAAAVLHVGSPERILQVECGEGDAALFLAREFPTARVRAVDRSEAAVREAAARVGLDPEGRIAFRVGGPRRLPFPDRQFDLLVFFDARPAPAEAARVLRPGGFLVLAAAGRDVAAPGIGGRLLRHRLAGRGFAPIRGERAGDGSFSVSRLDPVGRGGSSL